MRSLSIVVTVLLSGCVTQLTEFDREWRREIDRSNWELCMRAYHVNNAPTMSRHPHDKHRKHRHFEIREDLSDNRCRMVLREHWIEY